MCSPRSVLPGAVAQSTSPRVATSIGAFLIQTLRKSIFKCLVAQTSQIQQQAVQEETAKLARPNSRPDISVPSLAASTCRPVSLVLNTPCPSSGLPIPHPLVKLAGRAAEHLAAWKKITSNQWVLQAVKWVQAGVHLTTTTVP